MRLFGWFRRKKKREVETTEVVASPFSRVSVYVPPRNYNFPSYSHGLGNAQPSYGSRLQASSLRPTPEEVRNRTQNDDYALANLWATSALIYASGDAPNSTPSMVCEITPDTTRYDAPDTSCDTSFGGGDSGGAGASSDW